MRHFESGAAKRAAATAGIPIINAGDGPGQHPTQVRITMSLVKLTEAKSNYNGSWYVEIPL